MSESSQDKKECYHRTKTEPKHTNFRPKVVIPFTMARCDVACSQVCFAVGVASACAIINKLVKPVNRSLETVLHPSYGVSLQPILPWSKSCPMEMGALKLLLVGGAACAKTRRQVRVVRGGAGGQLVLRTLERTFAFIQRKWEVPGEFEAEEGHDQMDVLGRSGPELCRERKNHRAKSGSEETRKNGYLGFPEERREAPLEGMERCGQSQETNWALEMAEVKGEVQGRRSGGRWKAMET